MIDGEAWPRIGLSEVLDALEASPLWHERGDLPPDEGIGLAVGYWPGANSAAAAACKVSPDGSIQIVTGTVDMSGVEGGFQAIVAEVLGVEPSTVGMEVVDTAGAPATPGSGGSTITYSVGRAIRLAAEDARNAIFEAAALQLEIAPDDLELAEGTVRPKGTPERAIPLARLVRRHAGEGRAPIEGHARSEILSLSPSVAAHVAHVRVDRETGRVEVLRQHLIQDVGRVLNPALVAGSTAPRPRWWAGRCANAWATTRTASPRQRRSSSTRCRAPRTSGRSRPHPSRSRRPMGPSGRRASARRP